MSSQLYIYAIRNTVTKRIYIGETLNIQERFLQHWRALYYHRHKNELMQKDCNDFGLDSFTFSVIEKIVSPSEKRINSSTKEHEWMRRFNSTDPRFGYNYNENVVNKGVWTEPDWVKELKERVGKQPQKSSKIRHKEQQYED